MESTMTRALGRHSMGAMATKGVVVLLPFVSSNLKCGRFNGAATRVCGIVTVPFHWVSHFSATFGKS